MLVHSLFLFVLASEAHAKQKATLSPKCAKAQRNVNLINQHMTYSTDFCIYYLSLPRTRSPLLHIQPHAMTTACGCLLTQEGIPIPKHHKPTTKPSTGHRKCSPAYQRFVKEHFYEPKAFCNFYDALPRAVSPIFGVTANQLLDACACYDVQPTSSTPTKKPSTSTTTPGAKPTTTRTSSTTKAVPTTTTTTTATTATTADDEEVTTTTSFVTADDEVNFTTTTSPSTTTSTTTIPTTSVPTTTTTATTTTTTTTSSYFVTTTTTTPLCGYPPATIYGNWSLIQYGTLVNTMTLNTTGFGTTMTGQQPMVSTTLDASLNYAQAISSCAVVVADRAGDNSKDYVSDVYNESGADWGCFGWRDSDPSDTGFDRGGLNFDIECSYVYRIVDQQCYGAQCPG
ncbi:hypothetical protein K461DRAFT_306728 [Myriangium duriaei CBS 260.36]|uniref:Uncharacterized protein n=1 Tax=Myriangium duriaei CBS 260.36 TaxID=1168546 RepID=A0A9P4J383_9PEZI|nr:hypothetical protein K461DRAFT_306728 [Myriangium duriaei CBS 260.36]